jgi:hypothetical protein
MEMPEILPLGIYSHTRSDWDKPLRTLLDDPRGTGADRQITLYKETGSIEAVTKYLMRQTLVGIPLNTTEQPVAS